MATEPLLPHPQRRPARLAVAATLLLLLLLLLAFGPLRRPRSPLVAVGSPELVELTLLAGAREKGAGTYGIIIIIRLLRALLLS